jgi:hypothetical protein
MVDWNDTTVRLMLYLVYGTSFIIMFLTLTLWKERVSQIEVLNNFKYLAAFGLLHGLAQYSDIPRFLAWQPVWAYDIVKLILVTTSFAMLLAFGLSIISAGIEERRWVRGIPLGALIMYFWLLAYAGLDTAGISYKLADDLAQYSLGFLGAFVTTYAFIELSRKMNTIVGVRAGRRFMYAGICFAIYTVFGGLIVAPVFEVPVAVYRSAIAVLITLSFFGILRLFKVKNTE